MKHFILAITLFALASARAETKADPSETLWNTLEKAGQHMDKPSPELKKLLNQKISLAGWIVPNEFEKGELVSFILAHYPKGCIHVPLPPPESVIEVTMAPGSKKLRNITSTTKLMVEGTLVPGSRVDTAYKIVADSVHEVPL